MAGNKIRDNRGYTLVEMLMTIGIMGVLLIIFTTNYSGYRSNLDLRVGARKIASDIREMQNNALGLKSVDSSIANIPKGGWGLVFDFHAASSGLYMLWADKNGDHCIDDKHANPSNERLKIVPMPQNVVIENVIGADSSTTILFYPPDPIVYVNGSSTTLASITIKEKKSNKTSTITINPFGLVDIK